MSALDIVSVTKAYSPGKPVLDSLDLAVPSGALVALLGPSGCGKTTLLRIVAGFLRADAGTVAVGDQVVSAPGIHLPPERRRVGIVPQEGALFPHLSVAHNVAFGLDRTERGDRTAEMLDLVGLGDHGGRMPHELSGGQQQRIALARALAPRPQLVLLDEPFNALDSGLRAGVRADVRNALRATGATSILVTHDQQEALSTADLVAVIRDGKVVQTGTPQEIYRNPADPWIADFVGDAVLLPATRENGTARTPFGPIPLAVNGVNTGVVVLRPEQLRLVPAGRGRVQGTVTDVRFYGHDSMVTVRAAALAMPVNVRVAGPVDSRPGDLTGLELNNDTPPRDQASIIIADSPG